MGRPCDSPVEGDFADLPPLLSYLCVQNGARIKPEQFYRDLVKRNREVFGCGWGASEFRQGMITLGREFISPNETFPCADDVLAEAADHSTEVDASHYAVVHGALPRLSNNALSQHRWLSEEWGNLLGIGPHPPPEPVRVLRTKARAAKPPDATELAKQISGTVADAVMSRLAEIGLTPEVLKMLTAAAEMQSRAAPRAQAGASPGRNPPREAGPPRQAGANSNGRDSHMPRLERAEEGDGDILDLTWSSSLPAPPRSPAIPARPVVLPLEDDYEDLYSTSHLANPVEKPRRAENLTESGLSWSVGTTRKCLDPPKTKLGRTEDRDGGDLDIPSSSSLGNPFEFLFHTPPRAKTQTVAASVITTVPATRQKPPFQSPLHPFETLPRLAFDSQIRLPGQRKRTAAAQFLQREFETGSSLPKKRLRTSKDEVLPDESSSDEEDGAGESQPPSMGDFIVHDTPTPSNTGTQTSEGATLCRNFDSREMSGESTLRANIRGAIQDLVGDPNAREKSFAQLVGISLAMQRRQDAMVTMRTGGGKSMLWLVPALLDPDAKFIVVCPFTVLLDQQSAAAQKLGINATNYSQTSVIPEDIQILFLQVEHASSHVLAE